MKDSPFSCRMTKEDRALFEAALSRLNKEPRILFYKDIPKEALDSIGSMIVSLARKQAQNILDFLLLPGSPVIQKIGRGSAKARQSKRDPRGTVRHRAPDRG